MELAAIIKQKNRLVFQLQDAKADGDAPRVSSLARRAAVLEGQIAAELLADDRTEDAVVNLISQGSCLLLSGDHRAAVKVLAAARSLTRKPRLLEFIDELCGRAANGPRRQ